MINFKNLESIQFKYHTFIKLLVAWYVFDIAISAMNYDAFWGTNSIYISPHVQSVRDVGFFVWLTTLVKNGFLFGHVYLLVILQILIGSLILYLKEHSKVLMLLFFLLSSNLQTPMMYGLDGGNNLATILFLYYLMFDWGHLNILSRKIRLQTTLIAYLLSISQVVMIYLVAGFSKFQGEMWVNGTALYYIMQNPQYSSSTFTHLFLKSDFLLVLGNYGTMIFQVFFPLILFPQTNKLWLVSGVVLHLSISIVLGLLQFGIIMSLVYVLFMDDDLMTYIKHKALGLYGKAKKLSA